MLDETKKNDLQKLKDELKPMWERIARAEKALAEYRENAWHFVLLGFDAEFDLYELSSLASIRRIHEPPTPLFLQFAADNLSYANAVSRYCASIRYEMVLPIQPTLTEEQHFTLAWQLVSAIRLSSLAELLIPAVSDYPWSMIPGIKDQRVRIRLIEDVPRARVLMPGTKILTEHLDWVRRNFKSFMELIEIPKFRLASEALTTHHLQHNDRMMAAHVWVGIEALFEVQTELRFRLATLIATLLQPPGPDRRDLFKHVQRLYDMRSKVVHGASLELDAVKSHIIQAREILARLLRLFVELGSIPKIDEIEIALFSGAIIT